MDRDFKVEEINGRLVCIAGIGRLFYQEGFPVSMSVAEMRKRGVSVSMFHVAAECLENGWPPETVYSKLKEDIEDFTGQSDDIIPQLNEFCFASRDRQKEMIFSYLFGDKHKGEEYLKNLLNKSHEQ